MTDDLSELEADLEKLGERLRRGWAKMYSPSEKELEAVLEVVREQWEKEQQLLQSGAESKEQTPQQTTSLTEKLQNDRTRRQSPEQDRGHSR